ncbi:hypothetical protein EVAR_88112_1 [Eumeta japonica]|uniref:Uncharacterized protein n=1 Tax=Eumeta variegata TaxID=151549 RepID=A0A4C2A3H5_EUMVA|nr:hypothetical protein EVAR_88112_1 [Eumeta japonica]
MCTPGETWRSGSASATVMASGNIPRSPSHESVNTDLSLFSVSSAASDAKVLKLLACKAGQGPDPLLRVASPNPDSKLAKRGSRALLSSQDNCRDLLAGCAALCAALGLRRSFSTGDVGSQLESPAYALRRMAHWVRIHVSWFEPNTASREPIAIYRFYTDPQNGFTYPRNTNSELGVCAALEARALGATSRSCSTWVAVGGSQLPSPQRAAPPPPHQCLLPDLNKKVRQNYIKRRLLTTYRALERVSQSEFNLDRLEAAAANAVASAVGGPGPTTLTVPHPNSKHHTRFVHPGRHRKPSRVGFSSSCPAEGGQRRPGGVGGHRGGAPSAHRRRPGTGAGAPPVQIRAQHDDIQLAAHPRRGCALLGFISEERVTSRSWWTRTRHGDLHTVTLFDQTDSRTRHRQSGHLAWTSPPADGLRALKDKPK